MCRRAAVWLLRSSPIVSHLYRGAFDDSHKRHLMNTSDLPSTIFCALPKQPKRSFLHIALPCLALVAFGSNKSSSFSQSRSSRRLLPLPRRSGGKANERSSLSPSGRPSGVSDGPASRSSRSGQLSIFDYFDYFDY